MSTDIVGRKHDAGKPAYNLIPPNALHQVVLALTRGAEIYGPDNWRQVQEARPRYFAAANRHLWAYFRAQERGDDMGLLDKDSGLSHLAHAVCSLLFMLELDLGRVEDSCEMILVKDPFDDEDE